MKTLVGYIPENLCIFSRPEKLEQGYWDDFEMDGNFDGAEVLASFAADATNPRTQETAQRWAKGKGSTKISKPNTPFKNLRIVSLEKRGEGGRAWKVLTDDNLWERRSTPLTMKYSRKGAKWVGYWDDVNGKTAEVSSRSMCLYGVNGTVNRKRIQK